MSTITSANSKFVLSSADLSILSVQIEGYATDDSFAVDAADTAENVLGVDGKMSSGWIPRMYKMTVSLQADSSSRKIFDIIAQAQDVAKDVYKLNGVITLPSIGKMYTLTNGVLTNYKPIPDAKKTLGPTSYVITWESIQPMTI